MPLAPGRPTPLSTSSCSATISAPRAVLQAPHFFGALSERSARVALASDRQGIYSEFHQALMKEPRRLEDAVLREVADASGGNWAQLENDVTSQREAIDRLIARTRTEAFTLGLAGTPAYLIGHRLVNGALNLEEFKSAFRSARAV